MSFSTNDAKNDRTSVKQCRGCNRCSGSKRPINMSNKQAEEAVTPFLAKHVPKQYAPLGALSNYSDSDRETQKKGRSGADRLKERTEKPNTKYCYRHRPDLRCRRQADEPSMEQLQAELGSLPQEDQQGIAHVWALFSAAPSKHRNLILRGILAQCCFQQLSFLSAALRDLIKIDFISALPTELGYKIFCYLDTTSLCKAAQVSQRWRSLADDDVVWHRMCEQHIDRKCRECGWGLPLLERKRLRTEKRQIQLRAQEKGPKYLSDINLSRPHNELGLGTMEDLSNKILLNGKRSAEDGTLLSSQKRACTEPGRFETQSPRPSRPWKDVYKARFKVGTNWKHGRCTLKILKGHTNGVMCMQLDDHAHILATGSYDATVKIWDLRSGECVRTLKGHTSGVRCLQFDDNRLISGSIDRTLKVWNWRSPPGIRDSNNDYGENHTGTGENVAVSSDYCLRTLTGHAGGVIGLHFDGNVLASGSTDRTVRIWDTGSRNTFLLRGHTDWVNAVRIDARSRTCFSASDDCTVRMWNLDTRACLHIFEGHVGQVQQLVLMPPEFEPGDDDGDKRNGRDDIHAPVARRHDGIDSSHTLLFDGTGHANGNTNGISDLQTGSRDSIANPSGASSLLGRNVQSTSSIPGNNSPLTSSYVSSSTSVTTTTMAPALQANLSSNFICSTTNHSPLPASSSSHSALLSLPSPSPRPSSSSAYAPPTTTTFSSPTATTATITPIPASLPPTYFLTSSLDSTLRLWSTKASPVPPNTSSPPSHLPCPSPSISSSSSSSAATTTANTSQHQPQHQPQPPIPTSAPLRTFFGHVEGVWALAADTLRAVSGAEDRTVKIWDPRTGNCLRTFAGHEAPVTCVALGDCRLVSGGEDCDVRVLGFGSW